MNKTITMLALILAFNSSFADEISLGLWSHHFDRTVKYGKCTNEKHNLLSYSRNGFVVGRYDNSHCLESYLAGYSQSNSMGIGYTVSIVSGYPVSMRAVDKYVVIPMVHYTKTFEKIGIRIYYVPAVLIATGFVIKF